MIITRTPFRVSFFGGGSDYEAWYSQNGGAFLACSINRYCYLAVRWRPAFFPEKHRIVWSKIETVNDAYAVEHPAVRAAMIQFGIDEQGIEINHFSDLPSRTGMGSSSAFAVGLLHALYALHGNPIGQAELAQRAIYLEQTVLAETVGIQDQIQTAHGGLNYVKIDRSGRYSLWPLVMPKDRFDAFQSHLMLFYTGISRHASQIASSQVDNIAAGKKDGELRLLQSMAARGAEILTGDHNLAEFGLMLHNAWMLKRGLSDKVSTPEIDEMYAAARAAGALGGKLLGAGGGGFLLMFARPEAHADVRKALPGYLEVPFKIEYSGSRLIHGGQELAG